MKSIPEWIIIDAVLIAVALYFCYALKGYSYLGYTLIFAALLNAIYRLCPRSICSIVTVLVCLGLIYFFIIEIPIVANAKGDSDNDRRYIIVLGAEVVGRRPSRSLNYRINEAYEYLAEHPASIAVLSGGKGENEGISEARCMYNSLTEKGIEAERLLLEDKSTSTMENLRNSFEIIRDLGDEPSGNVAILSSSYHIYRAKQMSRLLGVESAGVVCYPGNPFLALNFFIREAFGMTQLIVLGK